MRPRMIGVAAVFLIGTIAGVAMSSGPNAADAKTSGMRVCINKSTGVIRSTVAGNCTKSEKSALIGSKGPRGRRGPRGATGATGADGTPGTDGATGETGPAGPAASWSYRFTSIMYAGSVGGGCGDGSASGSSGYVYTGGSFIDLIGSWNWMSVPSCTLSFYTVVP